MSSLSPYVLTIPLDLFTTSYVANFVACDQI